MVSHPTWKEPNIPINKQTNNRGGNGHTPWCLVIQVTPRLNYLLIHQGSYISDPFRTSPSLVLYTQHPSYPRQTLTNRNPTSSEDTPLSLVSSSSLPSSKDVSPHGSVSLYYTSPKMVLMKVSRFNSDDNYPNNSYRDRIRFLLFVSWWTVVFTAGYLAFFIINAGSFLVSIASHGIFLALT